MVEDHVARVEPIIGLEEDPSQCFSVRAEQHCD
jgi:hypothetical protein